MSHIRAIAAQVLHTVLTEGKSFHPHQFHMPGLSRADRAFVIELCFGVLRWYPRLATFGNALLKKPFSAKDQDLWYLLLIGLYQSDQLKTPPHAAIYETVAAVRHLQKDWARGVLNATLRRFENEHTALYARFQRDQVCQTAHPIWLLRKIQNAWPLHAAEIVQQNQQRPPLHLRVNCRKTSVQDYLTLLASQAIIGAPLPHAPEGIQLAEAVDVSQLPGFADGLVSVQDIAAQWTLACMALQGKETILDVCAAPGGKTAHILERYPQTQVTAWEKAPARYAQLESTLQRLGLIADLQQGDALLLATQTPPQSFDRILLDAPCSGSGVIRRHPEIKYRLNDAVLEDVCAQQSALLAAVWPLLRPQGRLIYTTCTIFPEENDRQIAHFLSQTPDARALPISFAWGHPQPCGRQVFPGEDGADGFFYAVLEKGSL